MSSFLSATTVLALSLASVVTAGEPSTVPKAFPAKEGFKHAPAFPGAEGYAKYTSGGRYGRVLLVTTLDDYDPETEAPIKGSLRKATGTSGPRTVLFRVSGTIELKDPKAVTKWTPPPGWFRGYEFPMKTLKR